MKTIFKVGDKVYHWKYGWGEVAGTHTNTNEEYPILVKFNLHSEQFTIDGRTWNGDPIPSLSFTEYDFVNGGFSQVRPKPRLPEIKETQEAIQKCKEIARKIKELELEKQSCLPIIKKDTLVYVRYGQNPYCKRHFSHFGKNGEILCFFGEYLTSRDTSEVEMWDEISITNPLEQ